ncbi:hypothetical protein DAEQUDRAFT_237219 [Daedalea quercina L-15889]|uniref:Uncharacterized protein n=1 Tax=Daedalea quercina L-15889 TaxID=1314783 RepID=A0A165QX20_9APHY|nr:hypothetical protein DAEQUDRAFT_237219 [Daedalea quercina L-15889]
MAGSGKGKKGLVRGGGWFAVEKTSRRVYMHWSRGESREERVLSWTAALTRTEQPRPLLIDTRLGKHRPWKCLIRSEFFSASASASGRGTLQLLPVPSSLLRPSLRPPRVSGSLDDCDNSPIALHPPFPAPHPVTGACTHPARVPPPCAWRDPGAASSIWLQER